MFCCALFALYEFNRFSKYTTVSSSSFNIPAGTYLLKVNNRNTRTRCEICSKLTIKTPERRQWHRFGVFIDNFEHIAHPALVFLLLTLKMQLPAGIKLFCFCLLLKTRFLMQKNLFSTCNVMNLIYQLCTSPSASVPSSFSEMMQLYGKKVIPERRKPYFQKQDLSCEKTSHHTEMG